MREHEVIRIFSIKKKIKILLQEKLLDFWNIEAHIPVLPDLEDNAPL